MRLPPLASLVRLGEACGRAVGNRQLLVCCGGRHLSWLLDTHGSMCAPAELCERCWSANAGLQTFYHSEYFRSADRLDGVTIDKAASELLDLYDQICATPEFHLDMWLQRGDMQFISNHTTLHARTGYEDWPERNRKRHLLRLWLSL